MISARLKRFLDENGVGYDVLHHDPAFTSQEEAARMHISGYEFVKTVVVKLDGQYALAAVPAPRLVDFKKLARAAGVKKCKLATDEEVTRNENIVINAGTHAEAIRLRYGDFARLGRPRVGEFHMPPPAEVTAQRRAAAGRKPARAKPAPKKRVRRARKAASRKKAARKKKPAARKRTAGKKKKRGGKRRAKKRRR